MLEFDWIIPLKSRFCDVKFSISKNFSFQIRQVEKFWQNVLVDLQTILYLWIRIIIICLGSLCSLSEWLLTVKCMEISITTFIIYLFQFIIECNVHVERENNKNV